MSKLYFRLGASKGFTSAELADKKEGFATPIRELLQNSLDAVREKGNAKCEINIHLKTIKMSDVPCIDEYKATLKKAVKTMKAENSYNDNYKRIVDSIEAALKQSTIEILNFVDNGIGMKQGRINALLDERSSKGDEESGGSFGVGHLSSYSLSSLRYVLYATQFEDDGKLQSLYTGAPILAGHKDDGDRGAIGRIVAKKPKDEKSPVYDYPAEFPSFMQGSIESDTGSAVAILGLSEQWNDDAEYAIVSNFFCAIAPGGLSDGLSIKIHQNGSIRDIDDIKTHELITSKRNDMRRVGDNILSGHDTWQAWRAYTQAGQQKTIALNGGNKVHVYIATGDEVENSTIALVRNGMLIARHDEMLSSDIANLRKDSSFEPFVAIVGVDMSEAKELFRLVKGAENPYHNKLVAKNISSNPKELKRLRELFKDLSEKIKQHLTPINREEIELPLFSVTSTASEATASSAGANAPSSTKTATQKDKSNAGKKPSKKGKTKKVKHNAPIIKQRGLSAKTAVRVEKGNDLLTITMRIHLTEPHDGEDSVHFSALVGEDKDTSSAHEYVDFQKVTLNGQDVFKKSGSDKVSVVELGKLNHAKPHTLIAEVTKPSMISASIALMPILRLKKALNPSKKGKKDA